MSTARKAIGEGELGVHVNVEASAPTSASELPASAAA